MKKEIVAILSFSNDRIFQKRIDLSKIQRKDFLRMLRALKASRDEILQRPIEFHEQEIFLEDDQLNDDDEELFPLL